MQSTYNSTLIFYEILNILMLIGYAIVHCVTPTATEMNPSRKSRDRSTLPGGNLSPSKKRLFLVITVLSPLLLLAALELCLRIFGYGPNMALFTKEEFGGKTYHIMNPDVKFRYFSTVAFSPNTSLDYFLVPKPKGMFRIFCLGGSTTIGFPYGPIGSFSTFLRDRLKAVFPDKQIEVINLGMTATNSYTVADIAKELVNYEPNLIIVYDGHNEFYGALGIASNETVGRSRFLTDLYLRLVHVRTFLLLRSFIQKVGHLFASSSQPQETGTLMERLSKGKNIPLHSPDYTRALQIFKANLDELVETFRSHKIPLIVSPQVSNLRDEPPFVSEFDEGSSPANQARYLVDFQKGKQFWDAGIVDSALTDFRSAASLDSVRADAPYWIGRCLDSLGRTTEAKKEYVRARDLDQLRFRASSDFNEVIKQTGDNKNVFVAGLDEVMSEHSRGGIVGNNLILEHLHPRLEGNFLIAKEYARVIRDHDLLGTPQEWAQEDTISDETLWSNRPLTIVDNLAAELRIAKLTSEWPFTMQTPVKDSVLLKGTLGTIVNVLVNGQTTWERAHVAAAEYFQKTGDSNDAEREYKALINQLRYNNSAYLALGQLYGFEKKDEQSKAILRKSLTVEASFEAYYMLGTLELGENHPERGIPFFERCYSMNSTPDQHTSAGFLLALSKARTGNTSEARTLLQEILALNPTLKDARSLLNSLNGNISK